MTNLWTGDFEEGDVSDYSHTDISNGAVAASTTQKNSGTYSSKHTTTAASSAAYGMHFADADNLHTTDRVFFFRWYIYPVTLDTDVKFAGIGAWNSTIPNYVSLRLDSTNHVIVRNEISSTDVGTSTATVPDNQWTLLELRYKPNDTTGEIELRIAESSEVSVTSQDVKDGANGDARMGAGVSWTGANSQEVYFDDLCLNDDQGGSDDTWCGAVGGAPAVTHNAPMMGADF